MAVHFSIITFPRLFSLRLLGTWMQPKEVSWFGMLTKGVHSRLGQHQWDACSWDRPSLLWARGQRLSYFCFFCSLELQRSCDSKCTHLADLQLPWFCVALAFKVFITVQLLEQGIKSGSFTIDSKFGETCCEFGKGVLSGGSLESSQHSIPNVGPQFPQQL